MERIQVQVRGTQWRKRLARGLGLMTGSPLTTLRVSLGQLMDNGCLERLARMVIRDTQTAVQQRKVRPLAPPVKLVHGSGS